MPPTTEPDPKLLLEDFVCCDLEEIVSDFVALLYEQNFPLEEEDELAPFEDAENVEYCSPLTAPLSVSLLGSGG